MPADFVYVNTLLSYTGKDPDGVMPASVVLNYTTPILNNPLNYYGCISRFNIQCSNIPLIFPLLDTNLLTNPSKDVNQLVYQFALGYNGIYSDPINIEYIPSIPSLNPPSFPMGGNNQDTQSVYYYIYSYNYFCQLMNNALSTALTNLNGKTTTNVTTPPLFYYNANSEQLVLQASVADYTQGIHTSPDSNNIQIYFNSYLAPFFLGYSYALFPNVSGCNNAFYLFDQVYNIQTINSIPTYVQPIQGSAELCNWASAIKISILTNMPVAKEYTQIPTRPGTIQSTTQSQTEQLLTDFILDNTNILQYNTQLVYNKTDSLRMFEFVSSTPMNTIDLTIIWSDSYGNSAPINLSVGQNITLKFEFIRKEVYSSGSSLRF
jgi:hypothetical protein